MSLSDAGRGHSILLTNSNQPAKLRLDRAAEVWLGEGMSTDKYLKSLRGSCRVRAMDQCGGPKSKGKSKLAVFFSNWQFCPLTTWRVHRSAISGIKSSDSTYWWVWRRLTLNDILNSAFWRLLRQGAWCSVRIFGKGFAEAVFMNDTMALTVVICMFKTWVSCDVQRITLGTMRHVDTLRSAQNSISLV